MLHPKYIPFFTSEQRKESYNLIQKVIDALGSPEIAVDDRHGPKLYSTLLTGLLATVKLDAPYPGKRGASHTRKASRNSSSIASSSPSRSSLSPIMQTAVHLNNSQVSQLQVDDGQNSSGDGESPSSMKGLNVQEFFAPPLPFDGELLHSMQNLTNSREWEGMALPGAHHSFRIRVMPHIDRAYPGWNWMGGLQPSGEMQQSVITPGNCPPLPPPGGFSNGDFSTSDFQRF